MLVRAIVRGYYRWMRYAGDEFDIPDHLYTPYGRVECGWMEKVDVPVHAGHQPAHAVETIVPSTIDPALTLHEVFK